MFPLYTVAMVEQETDVEYEEIEEGLDEMDMEI